MQPSEQSRFDIWLAEAKRLRSDATIARAEFLRHLAEGEKDTEMWADCGQPSFAALLSAENIVDVSTFETFKREVEQFGWEFVRTHGFDVVREVLPVKALAPSRRNPDKLARVAIEEELTAFRERHGVPASARHARTMIRMHYEPPPPAPRPMSADQARIVKLTEENANLKNQLDATTKELAKAKHTIRKLERQLGAKGDNAAE